MPRSRKLCQLLRSRRRERCRILFFSLVRALDRELLRRMFRNLSRRLFVEELRRLLRNLLRSLRLTLLPQPCLKSHRGLCRKQPR